MAFRLAAGADEQVFLRADERVQSGFAYQQRGLLRRTTTRSADGEWLVVSVWGTNADAEEALAAESASDMVAAFASMLDESTVRRRRYTTLD
jgi:hypothetical protein